MLKRLGLGLVLAALVFVVGCAAHTHMIGSGPQVNEMVTQRQWYVLWGLVPINNVDSKTMAAGATDYQIRTETSLLDGIINIFTSWVTVYSRTVIVTK